MAEVVLITGCSTGIGRDMANELTRLGFTVVATARKPDTMENLRADLRLPLDVTDPKSVERAVAKTMQKYDRIDVLINNAGFGSRGMVEEIPMETVQAVYDVNVFGVLRMIHSVAPIMRRQGSGRIINISSIAGRVVTPVNGVYSSTKFALEALSDALRWELAPFGVFVVLIEPGVINTHFSGTFQKQGVSNEQITRSPYKHLYEKIANLSARMRTSGSGPEVVTRTALKAITSAQPKARYLAGVNLPSRLLLLLRDHIWEPVASRIFKFQMEDSNANNDQI
ncbi:MAG: SDR family oxidoreductase [Leptolinea sp.]|nr:SDR family oxidoreductase [Leptolinea sp.]